MTALPRGDLMNKLLHVLTATRWMGNAEHIQSLVMLMVAGGAGNWLLERLCDRVECHPRQV